MRVNGTGRPVVFNATVMMIDTIGSSVCHRAARCYMIATHRLDSSDNNYSINNVAIYEPMFRLVEASDSAKRSGAGPASRRAARRRRLVKPGPPGIADHMTDALMPQLLATY